ncbi:MAG: hypothetical protein DMD82_00290 [Candidatus Rokuibacteriota bacterium]|nr:MAG: hypothetical protein DMD82_00290 [Candidatus Rokubacteria bacterium]
MMGKHKPEAEQVAFFEGVHDRFRSAAERAGRVHHDLRIAGATVRLAFAGESLVPFFTRALAHLRIDPVETPDATICLWDTKSTGVGMLPPPCDRDRFSDRGDLWGFHSRRIKTAFHYHDFSVNVFDHERNTGIYWVQNAQLLPYWTLASPLRTLFHWWMERRGCQLLHAAAVGIEDRALLLVGKGGLGKSSTALACLNQGLQFLGDDYVIVRNTPAPTVYSLYATAKLNPWDLERFPELRPLLHAREITAGDKAVVFLNPPFASRIALQAPLEAIAMPRVTGRDDTRFESEALPVIQQAATFTTMSQLPYAGSHTHQLITELCASLPAFRLELGRDPRGIARSVSEFLRHRERRPPGRVAKLRPPQTPLVSVVIPVYNGERFVAEAIHNVLDQEYPALEIIVVDDGSTDRTEAAVRAIPVELHYFKQENLGPAAARNRGIRDASGDYVAFLDVDDLWPPHTLATLMDELLRHPELDLVQGYSQVTEYEDGAGVYEYRGNPMESFPYSIATALYRKRVFDRVGLFDKTLIYGEDTDWFNRAHELGVAMKRLDLVTLVVRRHGRNMTQAKSPVELNMLRVFKKSLDRKREDGDA